MKQIPIPFSAPMIRVIMTCSPIFLGVPDMKKIPLTKGQLAFVDGADYDWLSQWKWYATWSAGSHSYYAVRSSNSLRTQGGRRASVFMHREILGLAGGDHRQADHINHVTTDNRRLNLRIVTHGQNRWNLKDTKGYYFNRRDHLYQALIQTNGTQRYLGSFKTSKEARSAYLAAKVLYHHF